MSALTASAPKRTQYFASAMKYELIWQSPNVDIFYCQEFNFLKSQWHGLTIKTQIIADSEALLKFTTQFACKKMIIDVSKVEAPFYDIVDWVINDFGPRLNACGINYAAWIYSENSGGRPSADAILSHSITETVNIVFDNPGNAELWIKTL